MIHRFASALIGALMIVLVGASGASAQVYPPPTVPPTTDDGVGDVGDDRDDDDDDDDDGTRTIVIGSGTGSGSLPRTGNDSLDWAQAGLALIAAGGVIVLATRRRNQRAPAST